MNKNTKKNQDLLNQNLLKNLIFKILKKRNSNQEGKEKAIRFLYIQIAETKLSFRCHNKET